MNGLGRNLPGLDSSLFLCSIPWDKGQTTEIGDEMETLLGVRPAGALWTQIKTLGIFL